MLPLVPGRSIARRRGARHFSFRLEVPACDTRLKLTTITRGTPLYRQDSLSNTRQVRATGEKGGAPPWSASTYAARLGILDLLEGSPMSDPSDIYNWRRLDCRITSSGQPSDAQLLEINNLGIRHIINLGLHSHERALPDEAASVANLGMTYIHIPVDFERPTEEDFNRFCTAMSEIGEAPVHIHCIVNARVTAFLYRYQRDVLGREEGLARALMNSIWRPGGVWARFIGDEASVGLPHRPPQETASAALHPKQT